MNREAEPSTRKPRSDAQRNRARLLASAKSVLAAGSGGASLEAVAREAGVGIGTLYRHFPTREALYEAVYRHEVSELVTLAETLERDADTVGALRHWLHEFIGLIATKKGMIAALALTTDKTSEISARVSGRMSGALQTLLTRAVDEGRLRGDVTGDEMLLAVVGICMLRDQPDWQESAAKMVGIMVDGLVTEPDGPDAQR